MSYITDNRITVKQAKELKSLHSKDREEILKILSKIYEGIKANPTAGSVLFTFVDKPNGVEHSLLITGPVKRQLQEDGFDVHVECEAFDKKTSITVYW